MQKPRDCSSDQTSVSLCQPGTRSDSTPSCPAPSQAASHLESCTLIAVSKSRNRPLLSLGSRGLFFDLLQLLMIHLQNFLRSGRLLRPLIIPILSCKPWKTNRQTSILPNLTPSRRMNWTQGDLRPGHLQDHRRHKPDVRHQFRIHSRMLMRNLIRLQQLLQLLQILILKTGSKLRNRPKHIYFLVISRHQQSPILSTPPATAGKGADNSQIHRVLHLGPVLALVLDPDPTPRPRLVHRIGLDRFRHNTLATILDRMLHEILHLLNTLRDHLMRKCQPLSLNLDQFLQHLSPLRIGSLSVIHSVHIQHIKGKETDRNLLNHPIQLILSTPTLRYQLKRQQFTSLKINRNRLALNNELLSASTIPH